MSEAPGKGATTVVRFCAAASAALGALALLGWITGLPPLTGQLFNAASSTKPITGIALLLAAGAMWLQLPRAGQPARWRSRVSLVCSGLLFVIGGWGVLHTLLGVNDALEGAVYRLFAGEPLSNADHMSLLGAACLLLVALTQICTLLPRSRDWVPQVLALPVVVGSTWALIGCVIGTSRQGEMALNTALGCLLLVVGTRSLRPSRTIAAALESLTLPGRLIRLLPLALVLPILFGALPAYSEKAGWLSVEHADELQLLLFVASIVGGYLLAIGYVSAAERRLLAEQRLLEQQARYKQVVEASHDGIWLLDADNRVTLANCRMEQLLGYAAGELLGRHSSDFYDPVWSARLPEIRERARRGQFGSYELQLRRQDGSSVWTNSSISPLLAAEGSFDGVLAMVTDISERKAAEQERERSLSLLRATLEASAEGIIVVDSAERFSHVNQRFKELWNLSPAALDSGDRRLVMGLMADQVVDREAFLASAARLDASFDEQLADTIALKDGRFFERYSTPQVLEGKIVGRVISVRDVTEEARARAERERSLALLRATLESTAEGILAIGPDNRVTGFNQHFVELWGMPEALLTSGDRQAVLDFEAQQLKDPVEFLHRSAEFTRRPEESFFETVQLTDGRIFERYTVPQLVDNLPAGRVVTVRDISERARALAALEESQTVLEEAQAAGGVGTWSVDVRSGATFWSPQLFKNLGCDPATTQPGLGALLRAVHPDDVERVRAMTSGFFDPAAVHEMEYRIVQPGGEVRWMHSRSRLVLDNAGQPMRLMGLDQDITERKLAQQQLERSLSLTQATLESTAEGVLAVDHSGRITAHNRRFAEMWDLSSEALDDGDVRVAAASMHDKLVNPEAFLARNAELQQTPLADSYDLIKLKDGRVFEQTSHPQLLAGESVGRVWGFVDITPRLEAEAELQRSHQMFSQLAETIDQVFWILAVEPPKLIYLSPAFERVYGARIEDALADPRVWLHTIHPEDAPDVFAASEARRLGQELAPHECEYRVVHPDGSLHWVHDQMHCLFNEQGELWALCGVAEDITARKAAAAERQKLEDQLRQAQKMEAIGTLAGGIAHDFNNILAAILGYATLVRDELPVDSQVRADQQEVLTAAERATDLVRHILAFSRQHTVETAPIRLAAVIKEVMRLLRASLPSTIALNYHIADDVEDGTVLGDVSQLHQILMNLCTNAGYAMKTSGGKLEIRLVARTVEEGGQLSQLDPGRYLQLSVKDTGPGIPPEIRERIFDPFFTTKGVGEGTGLGLSTVHGIVLGMGGAITVYSEIGQGTVFHVYLPRVDRGADMAAVTATQLVHGTGRILFVDDEAAIVRMAQVLLGKLGYSVTPAAGGPEAWEQFQANPQGFDLVISDQTMPGLTGDMLTQRIRELRPDCPVILCTGFSEILTPERLAELGITDFLTKPIAPTVMAQAVSKALGCGT